MSFANVLGGLFGRRAAGRETTLHAVRRATPQSTTPPSAFDPLVIWPVTVLVLLGLVMVYSASIAVADAEKQSYSFLVRQAIFLSIGLFGAWVAFQISMRQWQKLAPWLCLLGVLMLVAVLIPGVGHSVNGAQRWIPLGPVNFQPSELMKVFVVLYAADYTVRKLGDMDSVLRGFMPMAGMILLVGSLLLMEPDFGAFVVISVIGFGILFLGGLRLRLFVALFVVAVIGFIVLIWLSPYRRDRVFGFMDPWQDPFGKGYQLSHALIAFGRGEWFGVGLGGSIEKLFYLPEAHTDFLLAVIAEELGFVGVLTVVLLFAILVQRAFAIGREAINLERYFAGLVAMGIGLWLGVQSFINMGVNMGLLPTKGLTLPLMSFGGSAIVGSFLALAILLRVDWENRQMRKGVSP